MVFRAAPGDTRLSHGPALGKRSSAKSLHAPTGLTIYKHKSSRDLIRVDAETRPTFGPQARPWGHTLTANIGFNPCGTASISPTLSQ